MKCTNFRNIIYGVILCHSNHFLLSIWVSVPIYVSSKTLYVALSCRFDAVANMDRFFRFDVSNISFLSFWKNLSFVTQFILLLVNNHQFIVFYVVILLLFCTWNFRNSVKHFLRNLNAKNYIFGLKSLFFFKFMIMHC